MRKITFIIISLLLVLSSVSYIRADSPFDNSPITVGTNIFETNYSLNATKTSIHTFSANNWNEDGSTWTFTGGVLAHVAGNTTQVTATLTESIVAGTTYKVTITGTGGGGTATYTLGGVTGTTIAASGSISITDYIRASTTASMIITPASACTVQITNIKIEKLSSGTGDLGVEGKLTIGGKIFVPLSSNRSPTITSNNTFGMSMGVSSVSFTDGSTRTDIYTSSIQIIHNNANITMGLSYDLRLIRQAANHLALRNSTNPQTVSLFETYTDASNNEFYSIDAGVTTGDTLTIKANSAGTGSANLNIALQPKGTGVIRLLGHNVLAELTANHPTLAAGSEASIYMKGDKLIIAYNDSGTVKYRYLDLTSTDATWTYTTTAP